MSDRCLHDDLCDAMLAYVKSRIEIRDAFAFGRDGGFEAKRVALEMIGDARARESREWRAVEAAWDAHFLTPISASGGRKAPPGVSP